MVIPASVTGVTMNGAVAAEPRFDGGQRVQDAAGAPVAHLDGVARVVERVLVGALAK